MSAADPRRNLVAGRSCGECTACCTFFHIDQPDLQKPAGVTCTHAGAAGCGLYPHWPGICDAFFCSYRQLAVMGEDTRPDRLGVIFWTTGKPNPPILFETVYVVGAPLDDPRALDQPQVQALVEHFSLNGALPVFLQWGGRQHLIHPGPELADAILHPETTPHRHLVAQGRAWLEHYLPHANAYAQSQPHAGILKR